MGQSIKVATSEGPKQLDLEACTGAVLDFDGRKYTLDGPAFIQAVRDYMRSDLGHQATQNMQESMAAIRQSFVDSIARK